jgi:hypothetical protein
MYPYSALKLSFVCPCAGAATASCGLGAWSSALLLVSHSVPQCFALTVRALCLFRLTCVGFGGIAISFKPLLYSCISWSAAAQCWRWCVLCHAACGKARFSAVCNLYLNIIRTTAACRHAGDSCGAPSHLAQSMHMRWQYIYINYQLAFAHIEGAWASSCGLLCSHCLCACYCHVHLSLPHVVQSAQEVPHSTVTLCDTEEAQTSL